MSVLELTWNGTPAGVKNFTGGNLYSAKFNYYNINSNYNNTCTWCGKLSAGSVKFFTEERLGMEGSNSHITRKINFRFASPYSNGETRLI